MVVLTEISGDRNHRGDEVISAIRGFESVPPTVEKKYIRRQELVSVSLFKRTLGHYCSLGEVCRAVADGYRGRHHPIGIIRRSFAHISPQLFCGFTRMGMCTVI